MKRFLTVALGFFFAALNASTPARAADLPPRPPQYVLLAFDGSLNLNMWQETYDFAKQNDLKFTYFISGVYFVLDTKKAAYTEPTHGVGKSAIGWGGKSIDSIKSRVDWVNRAFDYGNEIASHVNGHFDGTKWTLAQWESEFNQFYHLIFDVFRINDVNQNSSNPYHFEQADIKGFRAPLLGRNPAMYQVLKERNFNYDTSQTAPMNYWPQKLNTVWNYPLAEVRIAGTGKKTLSMDYNFYYAQSAGLPQPQNYALFKKQMLDTYMGYFGGNYHGNRAPIHIGHHFSKWNGGAYWDAMKEFAQTVCRLPEVKCVTYGEYTKYLETLPESTRRQYQAGQFDRGGMPVNVASLSQAETAINADVKLAANDDQTLSANVTGPQAKNLLASANTTFKWSVNNKVISETVEPTLDLSQSPQLVQANAKFKVSVMKEGKEVLSDTHSVVSVTDADGQMAPVLSAKSDEELSMQNDPAGAHETPDEQ